MNAVHSVPIVHRNLRDEEALLQLFDSLASLDHVVNGTFNRIIERVNQETESLYEIQKRLCVAQSQVTYLQEEMKNKATTILCAPRYPVDNSMSHKPIHGDAITTGSTRTRMYLKDVVHLDPSQVERNPLDPDILSQEASRKDYVDDRVDEGLGRLPDHLPSVSGLILFNTQTNPYRGYVSLDNLSGESLRVRAERVVTDKQELASQPTTIKDGLVVPNYGAEKVLYDPELGDIPNINPDIAVLPGLDNVATLDYNAGASSIAPSSAIADVLPEIDTGDDDITSGSGAGTVSSTPSSGLTDLPDVEGEAPPPPPADTSGDFGGAPPPPPPPPDMGGPPSGNVPPPPPAALADLPEPQEGRGGLLEQIAGGMTLKKVDLNQDEMEAAKSVQSAPGIFGDLISALNRRRDLMGGNLVGSADEKDTKNEFQFDENDTDSDDWIP